MSEPHGWAMIAVEAAEIGGKLLQHYFRHVDEASIVAKQSNDWVSEADRASERAIIELLSSRAPDHAIFTEEAGYLPPKAAPSPYCWIIDPLDGTTNFLRGFPIWAVSVALEYRPDPRMRWGRIIAGAVSVPPTSEIFWAAEGEGAYRNGNRIRISSGHPLAQSLLATGFPFRVPHLMNEHFALFADLLSRCADIRRPGAAAVDLCYTALGVFDGFWELDLYPWDVAAGGLIIKEAGGKVSGFQGGEDYLTNGDIVAGNEMIFGDLSEAILKHFQHLPLPRPVDKSPGR